MTLVRRPSPFGGLDTLRQAMDRMITDAPGTAPTVTG